MLAGPVVVSPPASIHFPANFIGPSRLNPRGGFVSVAVGGGGENRTHLSNLDRVLRRQCPPPAINPITTPDPGGGRGMGFLKSLKLPAFFKGGATAGGEEMVSPRSMKRLLRLLSDSGGPSPRSSIAARWRLYHGSRNWAGLLDPLDADLRRELVRYGDLVGAAYQAFNHDPSVPADGDRPVSLPDGYAVTRGLHATSSVALPSWVESRAPPWVTQRSGWAGYVAICDDANEIRRMGRRDIVVALRGTCTCLEWAENFRASLVPLDPNSDHRRPPKVMQGFHSLYTTPAPHLPSLSAAVAAEVRRLVELYKNEPLSITLTGHSLGAALALLAAHDLAGAGPPVAVVSFGGPRVGNRAFADSLAARGVRVLRVANAHDVVTKLPGILPAIAAGGGYVDAGEVLTVDSAASPYLRPDADPGCCHDLEAYLHLVDGFADSGCPFRSNAKRSLARLIHQQRSNMKKLYVTKTHAIDRVDPLDPQPISHLAST